MKNQLEIITKFTLTFGITGMALTCLGLGVNVAGVTKISVHHFYQTSKLEPCIKKTFIFGNVLTGTGLFVIGLASGIAKYAGENYPDSYFTEGVKGFTEDEEKYLAHTHKCNHCKYFHGHQYHGIDLICGVHPAGFEGDNCPDWEQKCNN